MKMLPCSWDTSPTADARSKAVLLLGFGFRAVVSSRKVAFISSSPAPRLDMERQQERAPIRLGSLRLWRRRVWLQALRQGRTGAGHEGSRGGVPAWASAQGLGRAPRTRSLRLSPARAFLLAGDTPSRLRSAHSCVRRKERNTLLPVLTLLPPPQPELGRTPARS